MADRDAYVKFGYDVDESSINRAIARANALSKTLDDQRKGLANVATAAKQAGDALIASQTRAGSLLEKYRDSLRAAAKEIEEVGKKSGGATQASGGFRIEALRRTGGALSRLGLEDIGGAVAHVGELAQVGKELGAIAAEAGPFAVAIGGAVVALKALDSQLEGGTRQLESAVSSVRAYYDAIEKGTTESVQNQLDSLKKRNEIELAELKQLEEARAAGFTGAQKQFGDLGARLVFSLGEGRGAFKPIDDQIEALKKSTGDAQGQIAGLTRALADGATTANDAAEAEKKLAQQRAQRIDLEVQASIKAGEILKSSTSEQVDLRLAAAKDEQRIIQNAVTRLEAIGDKASLDKVEEFKKRLEALDIEIGNLNAALPALTSKEAELARNETDRGESTQRLIEVESDLSNVRERETQFIEKAAQAMDAFADATAQIADERRIAGLRESQDFTIKRARDNAEFTRKQAADDTAYYKDRAKKVAAFNAEVKQSDNEALKARVEAIAQANQAQIDAAENFARVVKGFTEQIDEAGANLDAVGVRNAQRGLAAATDQYNAEKKKRDSETAKRLAEIDESAKAERDKRAEVFAQDLADADAQHAEQRRQEAEDFRRQQQQEDEDRRLRLQRQQEDYARQDQQRKAAFDRQIAALQTQLLYPEEKAKVDSYARQRSALAAFLNGSVNDINTAAARMGVATTTASQAARTDSTASQASRTAYTTTASQLSRTSATSTHTLVGFAGGGEPPLGVRVRVGERGPEDVIFKDPARIYPSGMSGGGTNYGFYGNITVNGQPAPGEFYNMARQAFVSMIQESIGN